MVVPAKNESLFYYTRLRLTLSATDRREECETDRNSFLDPIFRMGGPKRLCGSRRSRLDAEDPLAVAGGVGARDSLGALALGAVHPGQLVQRVLLVRAQRRAGLRFLEGGHLVGVRRHWYHLFRENRMGGQGGQNAAGAAMLISARLRGDDGI